MNALTFGCSLLCIVIDSFFSLFCYAFAFFFHAKTTKKKWKKKKKCFLPVKKFSSCVDVMDIKRWKQLDWNFYFFLIISNWGITRLDHLEEKGHRQIIIDIVSIHSVQKKHNRAPFKSSEFKFSRRYSQYWQIQRHKCNTQKEDQ